MLTIDRLKPCPFCGSNSWEVTIQENTYTWTGLHAHKAQCGSCFIIVLGENNHRTIQASLASLKRYVNRRPPKKNAAQPKPLPQASSALMEAYDVILGKKE